MEPGGSELFSSWQSMVRVCERVLDSRDDAEDCAQEALLQACAEGVDDVDNVEAYLVAIAKRRAMDVLRRRVRTRRQLMRLASRCEPHDPDPAERVADEAEARWLSGKADELLTPPARAVLHLVADGGSVNDAAARLAMTRRSAESHLHRARLTLRAARVAVPAFLLAFLRAMKRPATATATSVVLVAGVAVVAPSYVRPDAPETRAPAVAAPRVEQVTRESLRKVDPERRAAVGAGRTRTTTTRRMSVPAAPAPPREVAGVRTSAALVAMREEDRPGSPSAVEVVVNCVKRIGLDDRTIGC